MFSKTMSSVFGGLLIFVSLLLLIVGKPVSGIILAIIGLSLIPAFRAFLLKKTNYSFNDSTRKGLYYLLLVAFMFSFMMFDTSLSSVEVKTMKDGELKQLLADSKASEMKKRTQYFIQNKEAVLSDIRDLSTQKKYNDAIKKANQYSHINDEELTTLISGIQNKQREKKTKDILARLKKIPATQYEENYNLYKELLSMHPQNERYKSKMKHYGDKIAKERALAAAEEQFFGPKPVQSNWDGSYSAVERYLKRVMNDPDSLDMDTCSPVVKVKKIGWVVKCSYRGKNAFGGMVLTQNWFVIRQNQVILVEDSDAY